MSNKMVEDFMAKVIAKNPGEEVFHQAVREVAESLAPYIVADPDMQLAKRALDAADANADGEGFFGGVGRGFGEKFFVVEC